MRPGRPDIVVEHILSADVAPENNQQIYESLFMLNMAHSESLMTKTLRYLFIQKQNFSSH